MQKETLVSVIIPCFNAASTVLAAVNSCLLQSHSELELIVVDDGSTDGSMAALEAIKDSRLRIFSQQNSGGCSARNKGLEHASGSYIQYLDADDLLASDKIERQLRLFRESSSEEVVVSGEWGRFYTSPEQASFVEDALWHTMDPVSWLVAAWSGNLMMHPAAWLLSRRTADGAGPWNEQISRNEDGEYFTRVILQVKKVLFCPGARSYYRSGLSMSTSARRSNSALRSYFNSIQLSADRLLAVEDSLRTREAVANLYQSFVYTAYPKTPALVRRAEEKVQDLGTPVRAADGGPVFRLLQRVLGLKPALFLRQIVYSLGYREYRLREKRRS